MTTLEEKRNDPNTKVLAMTGEIEDQFRVAVKTPDDMLATIPVLLGFHPVDSVVFVGFQGTPKRAGMTARLDMEDYLAHRLDTVDRLADMYGRNGIGDIIVVFYGSQPDLDVERMFAAHGVDVLDVFAADNEPHQVLPALVEANAMTGRSVLPNRAAVTGSIDYRPGVHADHLDILLAVMGDVMERDRFITMAIQQRNKTLPLLITACQATGDDLGQAVCDLLAVTAAAAYRTGDGALAMEALCRSGRIDKYHTLSQMLMTMIVAGTPPEILDGIADEATQMAVEANYHGADLVGKWVVAVGVSP